MVFRNGSQGLGYYKDEKVSTIELAPEIRPMEKCTPMKLMISELLEATPKEAEEDAPKTTLATVKVRLGRSNPTLDGLEDLSCADDGSLSLLSKEHRLEGLCAFDTCNSNAWAGARKYLERTQADFVAIQEAKISNDERADTEQAARNTGWKTAIGACAITDADGKSAGVAICGRTHIGMKNSICDEAWPEFLSQRFMLKHVAACCRGGIHIGSCYLTSCSAGVKDKKEP